MKEEKTETLNEFFIWSNLCTLKLRPELYQFRYNLSAINVNQDTHSLVINVKLMDTISSALDVTQQHKRSFQQGLDYFIHHKQSGVSINWSIYKYIYVTC